MLTILKICKPATASAYLIQQARYKSKTHWAKLKKKTGPKYKALHHFDDFYGSVFGGQWAGIREALLRRPKYVALVNNYGDTEETMEYLTNRGAHCLKNLMSIQQDFHKQYNPTLSQPESASSPKAVDSYISQLQQDEIASLYPNSENVPERLDLSDISLKAAEEETKLKEDVTPPRTLDEALEKAEIDESRIIDPSMGISSEALYQYVPATKLKGMEEWVPESLHYSYYSKGKDFPLVIEPETEFSFPEHLKVMTFEKDSEYTSFPEPKRSNTGVFNYYPMDGASVVSVLALGVAAGERALDVCAAPGGKALAALQTLLPDVLVCNDASVSRLNRMNRIFRDYLIDFESSNKWRERVVQTHSDGRNFTDDLGFDKVLVDVPCTTDRHSVMEDENNIFRSDRIRERLKIPELQSQLLVNALRLVKVGGAVVYSTCSLSPIQNDGVVHMALKHAFENHAIVATIKDLSAPFNALSSTLHVCRGPGRPQYGQLILPDITANFGPAYISRLVRVR
ncbi:5-cytosine rRNA methyltransferase NSUN4 [Epargyreus clarus]|uniref:5-cytosine rRNA methyltransferase NSUN4 n=1 Tax=Epargyreus clarus TaxID=520877 RepID=UPI003C2C4054